ncbi:hypothetical protein REPUB_Repub09cG0146500 [Reevesia pubescens]
MELKKREKFLYGHVKDLRNEVKLLKENTAEFVEGEILEENLILNKEVCNLRMQLKKLKEVAGKKSVEGNGWKLHVILIVLMVVGFMYIGLV